MKLKCDEALPNFAFHFILRLYTKSHGDTTAKLDDERRAHKETQDKTVLGEKQIKQLQDQLVGQCRSNPRQTRVYNAWFKRLKLKYDDPLSNFAFNFILCRYKLAAEGREKAALQKQLEAERKVGPIWYCLPRRFFS